MSQDKVKLPRSSYGELTKIIIAYSKRSKPANLEDIQSTSGIDRTAVSRNNAFLKYIGVIEGGQKKNITDRGAELAQALGYENQDEIQRVWRSVIEDNEFLSRMVQAVQVRKGMEWDDLRKHIAYSAGEPKAYGPLTGAAAVVEILKTAGLVYIEEDMVKPTVKPEPDYISVRDFKKIDLDPRPRIEYFTDTQKRFIFHILINLNIEVKDVNNVKTIIAEIKEKLGELGD